MEARRMQKKLFKALIWLVVAVGTAKGEYTLSFVVADGEAAVVGSNSEYDYPLSDVVIPSAYGQYPVTAIKSNSFVAGARSVEIPVSVRQIETGAFSGAQELTGINVDPLNPNYASVNGVLFDKSGDLLHTYPRGRSEIEYVVPSGVVRIGGGAFTSSSIERIVLPDGVTHIGQSAFAFSQIEGVVLPSSVIEIGVYGFGECYNLTNLDLGSGVSVIRSHAFIGAPIESVTLPPTVSFVGERSFALCSSLRNVFFEGDAPGDFTDPFSGNSPFFKIWFTAGATGFTVPIWEGYPSEELGTNNLPPIADGGPDLSVDDVNQDGEEAVTLDGTSSSDPDGSIFSYRWFWDGGSAVGATVQASFPGGVSEVTLEVRDDQGASAYDSLTVTVGASPPGLNIPLLVESLPTEPVTVDATPVSGFPADFFYQWYFNDVPVPDGEGGKSNAIVIEGYVTNEGTWRVVVTNSTGSSESSFEYRVRVDRDGDGLSDSEEEMLYQTDPDNADSDGDGLSDYLEVIDHGTNPRARDSDDDGFDDAFELSVGADPLDEASAPDTHSEILTAVEFRFASKATVLYRIESSVDLETWTPVESGIAGNGSLISRLYSTRVIPGRYFRAVEE